ncbi:uncharacterized protein KQ657_001251 [Scheffersomyces spartinae]|uniref:Serine protease n=1 Tax=Scheffersomyces spartinae TaxID=45513 RepID=A0A9P7V7R3_9ASCO|nr:uncharacterized protein KQ657_001251 [Scheffersomyces spartinae]KAG7192796.1 hypothetical protein KQ657_001251 [Scheffersomyces spartinae]
MLYIPIAVRFVLDTETLASSGVHIVTGSSDYWITVSPTSSLGQQAKQVLINTPYINGSSDIVNWIDVTLNYNVFPYLSTFLESFARTNGFEVTPTPRVSFVSGSCPLLCQKVPLHRYKQYKPDPGVENGTPCQVTLCPFNLTNSLLFSTYVAHGSLTTRLGDSLGYLSDLKYLENMVGGVVVQTPDSIDIGVVAQHIRKVNGDGDLVVVLLWGKVLETVGIADVFSRSGPKRHLASDDSATIVAWPKFPVFPVRTVLTTNGHSSWGSCVLLKNDLLVTNTHVLTPYLEDPLGTVLVIDLPDGPLTILNQKHALVTPSSLVDISTISLAESDILRFTGLGYSPALYQQQRQQRSLPPIVGQNVVSVGYGLYLLPQWQSPGVSQGTLDLVFRSRYNANTPYKMPSLIITSASCWNGSSGGGLFRDNELVGIICSNAEVRVDGRPLEDDGNAPVEKLTRFVFVVPIELVEYLISGGSIEDDGPLVKTWKLDTFHKDRILGETKL